jgi:hypothetical protein
LLKPVRVKLKPTRVKLKPVRVKPTPYAIHGFKIVVVMVHAPSTLNIQNYANFLIAAIVALKEIVFALSTMEHWTMKSRVKFLKSSRRKD